MSMENLAKIPLGRLFGGQVYGFAQISPDGRYLSYWHNAGGPNDLYVRELAAGSQPIKLTNLSGAGVFFYQWAVDSRTLIFREFGGGDENYQCQAVNIHSGECKAVTPATGDQGHRVQALLSHMLNRNTSPERPDVFLAAMNLSDRSHYDLYAVNIHNGELELLAEGRRETRQWLVDGSLNVRGVLEEGDDGGLVFWWRSEPGGEFAPLTEWTEDDEMLSRPLAALPQGKLLLLDSTGRDTAALVEYNPATGERAVLLADPEYDAGGVELDPVTGELESAWIVREHHEWSVFAPGARNAYKQLAQCFAGGSFAIASRTLDNTRWVVSGSPPNSPSTYYLYDRGADSVARLFSVTPDLEQYTFQSPQPVSLAARDGEQIHGYLSEPAGFARPGPLVLLVHGGPWGRDGDYFDPEVQWLVDRGYACLQVNFRGSTGFGKRFIGLAKREWGGRMQDDLSDAAAWAVDQGVADKRRIVIMGCSFGGYAALAGAALTPGIYAGAISLSGISNLLTSLTNDVPHWGSRRRRFESHVGILPRYGEGERLGQPKDEADLDAAELQEVRYLKSRSPLFQADQVKCPVLLAHGANDPRCPAAESETFTAALRENGVDVDLVVYPNEGHMLAHEENRLDYYHRAEAFLRRVLG